jgi:long-chain acyl-CoA synthetase
MLPMAPRTLYQVLEETAAQYGDAPALLQPATGKDGKRQYLTYSWNQYKTAAQEIAAGLRSIGVRKGDVVALDSETRLEFYLADLGILATGGIAAALYPNYPPKDLIRTIRTCGAKVLFVEDPKTLGVLEEVSGIPRPPTPRFSI